MDVTTDISVKKLDLDSVLDQFGLRKRYYLERIILFYLALMFNGMYCMNFVFAVGEVPYRCKDNFETESFCNPSNTTHKCSQWLYDDPDSFFAYFDLACQEWKRALVGTMHSIGFMFGLLIIGPLSDKFGRKPVTVITGVLGAVFGTLRSFSTWYWFYIAMEFMEGAIGDNSSPIFILILEAVSKKKKLLTFMFGNSGVFLGAIVISTAAWLTPNWRWLLRVIYIPGFFFLTYKYFLDESPRWLLTKGRKNDAIIVLKNAAKKNKVDIDKTYLENLSCETDEKVPFGKLLVETFKSSTLRKRFIVCAIWWIASLFVHYGLLINSVSLQGNIYLNFVLISFVDVPGSAIVTYILIKFRRRTPLMLSFFIGAILCISQPFLPTNLPWLTVSFFMAGKLMSCFFFYITYVYTVELFPTYTRNSMHALCSSVGRIGSIVAPLTPLLMVYWSGLPSLVFGVAALAAGLSTFLVPDIADDALPDTVRQAEALGTIKNSRGDKREVR